MHTSVTGTWRSSTETRRRPPHLHHLPPFTLGLFICLKLFDTQVTWFSVTRGGGRKRASWLSHHCQIGWLQNITLSYLFLNWFVPFFVAAEKLAYRIRIFCCVTQPCNNIVEVRIKLCLFIIFLCSAYFFCLLLRQQLCLIGILNRVPSYEDVYNSSLIHNFIITWQQTTSVSHSQAEKLKVPTTFIILIYF